jgi:chromosome segregation ATPase
MDRHEWHKKIGELSEELKVLTDAGAPLTVTNRCVKRMYAAAEGDTRLYIHLLEEELRQTRDSLRIDQATMTREGVLTREIVERLRGQLDSLQDQQTEVIGWLRESRDRAAQLVAENRQLEEDLATAERQLEAATGMLAEAGAAEEGMRTLVDNLEEDNRREAARAAGAEEDLAAARQRVEELQRTVNRLRSERDYWKRRTWGETGRG